MEEKGLKMKITIEINPDDKHGIERIGNSIHEQLVGNEYYKNNGIVLCLDEDAVRVYIGEEVEDVPDIII